jgi:hypothetical protein
VNTLSLHNSLSPTRRSVTTVFMWVFDGYSREDVPEQPLQSAKGTLNRHAS